MQTGFEKVLNLRKYLINIGCQLNFQSGTLLYGFLTETSQCLKIHHIEIEMCIRDSTMLELADDINVQGGRVNMQ